MSAQQRLERQKTGKVVCAILGHTIQVHGDHPWRCPRCGQNIMRGDPYDDPYRDTEERQRELTAGAVACLILGHLEKWGQGIPLSNKWYIDEKGHNRTKCLRCGISRQIGYPWPT